MLRNQVNSIGLPSSVSRGSPPGSSSTSPGLPLCCVRPIGRLAQSACSSFLSEYACSSFLIVAGAGYSETGSARRIVAQSGSPPAPIKNELVILAHGLKLVPGKVVPSAIPRRLVWLVITLFATVISPVFFRFYSSSVRTRQAQNHLTTMQDFLSVDPYSRHDLRNWECAEKVQFCDKQGFPKMVMAPLNIDGNTWSTGRFRRRRDRRKDGANPNKTQGFPPLSMAPKFVRNPISIAEEIVRV